jgi:outer membrane protein OmpA-like peptidoglycan-associated protein
MSDSTNSGTSIAAQHAAVPDRRTLRLATTDGSKFNTIRVPLIPVACWRLNDPAFAFDSSFVSPDFRGEIETVSGIIAANQGCPAALFGHCDPAGDDALNKTLGDRRAIAIYALLTHQPALWAYLYDNPQVGDTWGTHMLQCALNKITDSEGHPFGAGKPDGKYGPKTTAAVKRFQNDKKISPADGQATVETRKALFDAYMNWLCTPEGTPSSPPPPPLMQQSDFLGGAGANANDLPKMSLQSCGKFNPVVLLTDAEMNGADQRTRNAHDAPNRRVMMFFFKKGSVVAPDVWPCPKVKEPNEACKTVFWPDGDARRKNKDELRRYKDTHNTMACRFYDRFARRSPCEVAEFTSSDEDIWARDHPGMHEDVRRGSSEDGYPGPDNPTDVSDPAPKAQRGGELLFWNYRVGKDDPRDEHLVALQDLGGEWKDRLSSAACYFIRLCGGTSGSESSDLAQTRAQKVFDILKAAGIPADRMVVDGTGGRALADETEGSPRNVENMARNRNVQAIIYAQTSSGADATQDERSNCTFLKFTNQPSDLAVKEEDGNLLITFAATKQPPYPDRKNSVIAEATLKSKIPGASIGWMQMVKSLVWLGTYEGVKGGATTSRQLDFSYANWLPARDWLHAQQRFSYENRIVSGKPQPFLPGTKVYHVLEDGVPDNHIACLDKPSFVAPLHHPDPSSPDDILALVEARWEMEFTVTLGIRGDDSAFRPLFSNWWRLAVTAQKQGSSWTLSPASDQIEYGPETDGPAYWAPGWPSGLADSAVIDALSRATARFLSRRRDFNNAKAPDKPARPSTK